MIRGQIQGVDLLNRYDDGEHIFFMDSYGTAMDGIGYCTQFTGVYTNEASNFVEFYGRKGHWFHFWDVERIEHTGDTCLPGKYLTIHFHMNGRPATQEILVCNSGMFPELMSTPITVPLVIERDGHQVLK